MSYVVPLAAACCAVVLVGCGGTADASSAASTSSASSTSEASSTTTAPAKDCLCIFDVDRTLTGAQGDVTNCLGNLVQQGIQDTAYGGGELSLSQLSQALQSTFCGQCYIGSISHGDVSGQDSAEQGELKQKLSVGAKASDVSDSWASGCESIGALIHSCFDGYKQTAVPSIIKYYEDAAGAQIADSDVHFFDDREVNINSFQGTGYNARQISCNHRDEGYGFAIGLCGAELDEIMPDEGQVLCPSFATQV